MHKPETVTAATYSQQMKTMIPNTPNTRTTKTTSVTELLDNTMPTIHETTMTASLTVATVASVAPSEDNESFSFVSAGPMAAGTTGGLVLLAAGAYILLKRLACNKVIPLGYGR